MQSSKKLPRPQLTSIASEVNHDIAVLIEVWTMVVSNPSASSVLDGFDLIRLGRTCHAAFRSVSSPRSKAKWAIARFGASLSLPKLYDAYPAMISPALIDSMISLKAHPPRNFVLLLVREKRAHERHAAQVDAHLKYQQNVKRRLEWRAMELEAQRLTNGTSDDNFANEKKPKRDIHDLKMSESEIEDDQTHASSTMDTYDDLEFEDATARTAIAMVPLPAYDQIPHVPYPDPVPTTNTSLLKLGVRDYIIEVGEDIYGKVFYASNAPAVYAERISLLPDELHWAANIAIGQLAGGAKSPVSDWPFDDAAMFTFLLKYGADVKSFLTTDAPKETNVIPTPETISPDGTTIPSTTNSVGYAVSRNQEAWRRICESIWALIDKHGFVPSFVVGDVLGSLKRFLRNGVSLDVRVPADHEETGSWILSEVLHYDEKLGRLLAKNGGVDQLAVENELHYWMLVDSRIQIAPKKHAKPSFFEELNSRKQLGRLPSPIPIAPLRRFLRHHASKHTIQRLCEYTSTPLSTIQHIGDDLIASLVSPANFASQGNPGASLAKVDHLVDALGVTPEALMSHFTIPDYQARTTYEAATTGSAQNQKPPISIPADDDLVDFLGSYYSNNQQHRQHHQSQPQLFTRIGTSTGSVPWSLWTHLVARFSSADARKSNPQACADMMAVLLHDLTVRHASQEGDDPARRWFGEKEADGAAAAFAKAVGGGIGEEGVFPATVVEVCRRIVEGASKGFEAVPARFVAVMERVEAMVVGAAVAGGEGSIVPKSVEASTEDEEGEGKSKLVKEWVEVLNKAVVENEAWQQVVAQSSTTEQVRDDAIRPEVRFYWAVVSIIDDATNLNPEASATHAHFAAWLRELEAEKQNLAASSLAPEVISGNNTTGTLEPSRLSSATSSLIQSIQKQMSASPTLQSINISTKSVTSAIGNSKVLIGGSKMVGSVSQSAQKLGTSIANSKVAEQVTAGASKLGAQVSESMAAVSSDLQKRMAGNGDKGEGKTIVTEEMAAEHRKTHGAVSLISSGDEGGVAEKKKEAYDKAWDRLSSRLSTSKK